MTDLIGGAKPRVYDRVPTNPTFPFVHIGDDHVLADIFQASGSSTVHATLHLFSRYVGKAEIKALAAAVRDTLDAPLAVTGFHTTTSEFHDARFMIDPDGLTEHAVMEFVYGLSVDQASDPTPPLPATLLDFSNADDTAYFFLF